MRWVLIAAGIFILLTIFLPRSSGTPDIGINQVFEMAAAGQVTNIEVQGDRLEVVTTRGETFKSRKESSVSVLEQLEERGIDTSAEGVQVQVKKEGRNFLGIVLSFLPLIIFGALMFWMLRGARGGISQAMNIGKSRAQVALINRPTVTFADVAGVEEAKQELSEIVEFLRYPEKFAKLGVCLIDRWAS